MLFLRRKRFYTIFLTVALEGHRRKRIKCVNEERRKSHKNMIGIDGRYKCGGG
jgi:hypothetical protein